MRGKRVKKRADAVPRDWNSLRYLILRLGKSLLADLIKGAKTALPKST